ncbi:MFS transporter [Actinophytocola oryzae]|uniref:UMF1 family MFS transporter n=1 Tax=Actinophytocola oryzae TaxID=502181 RepID=A0A4R7W145_9PSEU|nr:MFS transporter [Actinophytocola oryzae]TDV56132.1 UMF1 family MFS transporter [Actinophytocola oryzae]
MAIVQPVEKTPIMGGREPSVPGADVRRAWYAYDWANSVFSTCVTSTFFGPYLTGIVKDAADADGFVHPLGLAVRAASFYPFLTALSLILQVLVLPWAAALAHRLPRNRLLGAFAVFGAVATVGLSLVSHLSYLAGGLLFVLATLALGASVVVYDTYLPEIAAPAERAAVSSRGSAAGYLGTVVVMVLSLGLLMAHEPLGLSEDTAVALCLLLAGLWWAGFTLIPVRRLPATPVATAAVEKPGLRGFRRIVVELVRRRDQRRAALFLLAFFLYNNAILVISSQGTTFVTEELDVSDDMLVIGVLMVSVVAVAGTTIAGRLAGRFGAPVVLLASLAVWVLVIGLQVTVQPGAIATLVLIGILVGLVNGCCYALSRAVFANLTPADRSAEYFSLFEIVNRSLGAFGVLVFGMVVQITGNYRVAIGSMAVFFAVGALLLVAVGLRVVGVGETVAAGGDRDGHAG